jgi:hypothetical protein
MDHIRRYTECLPTEQHQIRWKPFRFVTLQLACSIAYVFIYYSFVNELNGAVKRCYKRQLISCSTNLLKELKITQLVKEDFVIYGNRDSLPFSLHKTSPMDYSLSQLNPVHTLVLSFVIVNRNICLSPMPRSLKWFLLLGFPTTMFNVFLIKPRELHALPIASSMI